jgi:hypothetical protein
MADSGELFGQLPVPNLEDRARLFLRAVYGERDFTSSERSDAREAILGPMAAHVASKSNRGMIEEPWVKPPNPTIEDGDKLPPVAMSMRLEEYQSRRTDIIEESFQPLPSSIEERQEPSVSQHYAAQIARARETSPSPTALPALASIAAASRVPRARKGGPLRSSPPPTRKPAKHRAFIWGAAVSIFTGLCVLGGLALYHDKMATRSEFVTARSDPTDTSEADARSMVQLNRVGSSGTSNPVAEAPARLPPPRYPMAVGIMPAAPKNLELSSSSGVVAQARAVIASGDIEAARGALSKLVESGNAPAAVAIGSTYDPNILDVLNVRNFPPDVAKARLWYQRAQQMGASEAAGLLESLDSRERQSR